MADRSHEEYFFVAFFLLHFFFFGGVRGCDHLTNMSCIRHIGHDGLDLLGHQHHRSCGETKNKGSF